MPVQDNAYGDAYGDAYGLNFAVTAAVASYDTRNYLDIAGHPRHRSLFFTSIVTFY